ncbi:MAG TPA: ABC transporter permease, partial [Microthrixaceae bacterium]|nr:ABC transporter permease [Microthrixaceae bacterium]
MLRLALRSARAHWRRFVLTATAVVVGVAFVVAAFVLTDSLARSIRDLLRDTAGRSDIVVRAATGSTGGPGGVFGGSRAGVPAALLPELAAVPGVAVADGIVSGPGQLLDKGGRSGAFDFSLVSNWPVEPDLFGVRLASGTAPSGPDDVVIDAETAAERGLGLGDRVRVATRRGIVDARISGIAEQRGTGLITAASVLAFSSERAGELVGVPGWYSVVNIGLEPGARSDDVQSALRKVGGPSVSVFSSEALVAAAQADIEEELTNFVGLLLGFAGVTLFVSAFLIWNTFTIVVAQRTRELALLRAVGASRRQVAASVIGEGLVVGAAASALGLGLGVLLGMGLQRLIVALGVALPLDSVVFELRTAVAGVVIQNLTSVEQKV